MQSHARILKSLFRLIVVAGVTGLLVVSAAPLLPAQSTVPSSAVQAARMPQYAPRLAHPATSRMPAGVPFSPADHRRQPEGDIYDNGPVNGQVDAWTINFGFVVTNSMQVTNTLQGVTAVNFWAWLVPGDTITNVEVSIGSSPYGKDIFDGFLNVSQSQCIPNEFGYNVCLESANFNNGPNFTGNTWVTLQNANVPSGDPVYWDENSGVGCQSPGCPSQAQLNTVGTIPSEAFTLEGNPCFSGQQKPAPEAKAVTVPRSPSQNYRVIYTFTGGADGGAPAAGLLIDAAGNLYGTNSYGGPFGGGTVFKLTPGASGWRFSRLYAFSGANGRYPNSALVREPNGRLIGTTGAGGLGVGVLFGLSPDGSIPRSVFSNWIETLLYSFTGGSDGEGPGGTLALDSSGNIYGSAFAGGANRGGTLYEFTNGGLQVLHAFPASGGDGLSPIGVVNGSDGLYGITTAGGSDFVGTLFTTAGGYRVLHSFTQSVESRPTSLAADQAGNFYGTSTFAPGPCSPLQEDVYSLSPPDWNPSTLATVSQGEVRSWVSADASGNLYGTTEGAGLSGDGTVFKLTCCWNYSDLYDFAGGPSDGANPEGPPVVDAQGNIYGTAVNGGPYGLGVVWEISP